ncbi:MAG TPA: adenylosuccinate synthase [Candidatus Thermoplasmatota archaeon]|nr:adenylosuccinate synthase [Candidatus Thermoplasmatota archaeon]
MPAVAIVGAQWGDEGKGKITDYEAQRADVVARYQGGNNAGHTIVVAGQEFKLHLLPAGVLHPSKKAVVGNGVVVDPPGLLKEIDELAARGRPVGNLAISASAHVIFPWHKILDALAEQGQSAVGSTKRGIGPVYTDKVARSGIRMAELCDPRLLSARLAGIVPEKQRVLDAMGSKERLDAAAIEREYGAYGARLRPFVADTTALLHEALAQGQRVLLEGAQGTLLDLDHGTYPFVTSSSTTVGGACTGTGIPPTAISEVLGVMKAYTTRVGLGPFPTELSDATGDRIAQVGREVGTTTGRKRRCGWLDLPLLRHAARVNGFTSLAVMKLDVLADLGPLRVCMAYRVDGMEVRFPPAGRDLSEAEPVWKEFDGFGAISLAPGARGLTALPRGAREYLEFVQREIGAPIRTVSVGPGREQTLEVA